MRQEMRSTNSASVMVWTNLVAEMTSGDLTRFSCDTIDPSMAHFLGGVGLDVADTGMLENVVESSELLVWTTWTKELVKYKYQES